VVDRQSGGGIRRLSHQAGADPGVQGGEPFTSYDPKCHPAGGIRPLAYL
jgi:hypothetical protein